MKLCLNYVSGNSFHSLPKMEQKLGLKISTELSQKKELFFLSTSLPWLSQVYLNAVVYSNGSQTLECIRMTRRDLLKHRLVGPTPRGSDSVGLEWGPRICTSNISQVMVILLVCVPHLENHWASTGLSNAVATSHTGHVFKYSKCG